VLDLNSLMVKKPTLALAPAVEPIAPSVVDDAPQPAVKSTPRKPPKMFRTSVYFSRTVHDKLRDIAHEERKSVTDLINEGLDHVLTSRNYATTAELRSKKS
jgi:hypothetical protein